MEGMVMGDLGDPFLACGTCGRRNMDHHKVRPEAKQGRKNSIPHSTMGRQGRSFGPSRPVFFPELDECIPLPLQEGHF
jgi:hypothetical protein